MAARSPARSSAGPGRDVELHPHLGGDDAGQRGLAEPGRPGEQQVVGGLAPPAGGLEDHRQVLLQLGAGRRTRRGGAAGGRRPRPPRARRPAPGRGTRHARRAARTFSASRRSSSACSDGGRPPAAPRGSPRCRSPSPASASRTSADRGRSEPCRPTRRRGPAPTSRLAARPAAARPSSCRRPGTRQRDARSTTATMSTSARRRVGGEDGQRQRRPDAVGGDAATRTWPARPAREAVQRLRVLADVVVDVEERARASAPSSARVRGVTVHEVADAADLEEDLAVGAPLEHRAPQRADHRRPPVAAATLGLQWGHGQVAQRERGGVGGVGRLGRRGQPQPRLHHPLHLLLARRAPAGHGLLDLVGRVLHDLAAGRRGLGQRQAAGLPHAHRRAHVDLEEHVLDGHDVRPQLGDERGQLAPQLGQALAAAGRRPAVRTTPSATARTVRGARRLERGVAAAGQPGIDAQDQHGHGPGAQAPDGARRWRRRLPLGRSGHRVRTQVRT